MTLEGQTLGEFEILERLGQGGMGAVYKARQLSLKRLVALKTLQPAMADDEAYIARFQQEAVAAAALNHPNLVQVYSAGESDGLHWFSMEYVEGESAKARLKREGRIDPRQALDIAIHVATALQYGWRKASLIHRDIKPDNIFLSRYGEVKLGDLGLAKSAGENKGLTTTGHSMGSPYYISPEQVQDMKAVDFRADIYSLGCTLFHLLGGRPPFDGSTATMIMLKHITDPVPILRLTWPECPPVLSDVVEKMMQKDPADRQQDYETVLSDLRHAAALVGARAAPVVSAPAPTPQSKAVPAASSDLRHASAVKGDHEAPTVTAPTPTLQPQSVSAASSDSRPASAVEGDREALTVAAPAPKPQSDAAPAGTTELRLASAAKADAEAPTVAGPAPVPQPQLMPPKGVAPARPNPPHKSKLLIPGEIVVTVVVIVALVYVFIHHGKKRDTDATDFSEPSNPQSFWRDWVLESRREGYFLNHPNFLDDQTEIVFKRRIAANSSDPFRNGKIRARCTIPPPNLPAQYVQFYVRMAPDANGVLRRYEAYLTRNAVIFATNDSAKNFHELMRWSQPTTPDSPLSIVMEIEARKNSFTVSLDRKTLGTVQDDTIPGAGTFGVDGPEGTRLSNLSFINLDPPEPRATLPTTK